MTDPLRGSEPQGPGRAEYPVLDCVRRILVIGDDELRFPPAEFSLLGTLVSRRLGLAADAAFREGMESARQAGVCGVCGEPDHDGINFATPGLGAEFLFHYRRVNILAATSTTEHRRGGRRPGYELTAGDAPAIRRMRKTLQGGVEREWFEEVKCKLRRSIARKGAQWGGYQIRGTEVRGRTCTGVGPEWDSVTIRGGPFGRVERGVLVDART